MIYSYDELLRWWHGLAKTTQVEIFQRMIVKSESDSFRELAMSLRDQWTRGKQMSERQLAILKKWEGGKK